MVELLKNTKEEKVLLALLSWFKTISELEDEREVKKDYEFLCDCVYFTEMNDWILYIISYSKYIDVQEIYYFTLILL